MSTQLTKAMIQKHMSMGHQFVFGEPNFQAEDWDRVTRTAIEIANWYKMK